MANTHPIIGKVHIKDLDALKSYHDSEKAKEFFDNNWKTFDKFEGYAFNHMVDYNYFRKLYDLAAYYATIDQALNLLYLDPQDRFAIICGPDLDFTWGVPCDYLSIEVFKDYSGMSLAEIRSLGENANPLSPASMDDTSASDIHSGIEEKREEIRKNKEKIEALEAQKRQN